VRHRIRALEVWAANSRQDEWAALLEEYNRRRADFLARIPADLRAAVDAALRAPFGSEAGFASLERDPFAPWALPMPADFTFPRGMVAWMLDSPREYWMGHHCGRCGLTVPLFLTWSNDPDPPPDLAAFPICPACGGRTSYEAQSRPATPNERGKSCG
jgi:hypothetical protein